VPLILRLHRELKKVFHVVLVAIKLTNQRFKMKIIGMLAILLIVLHAGKNNIDNLVIQVDTSALHYETLKLAAFQ